jgi:large subunit ribosomal protein L16
MLIPRRVKHRKQHRPDRHGAAKGGTRVTFGEYGIQAVEHSYVTNRQIEAARIAMTRHIRRGGKVWITIYPDRPLTKKPAETRMGSGKGAPEWWVANVRPGDVRAVGRVGAGRQGGAAPRDAQAPDEVQVRKARGGRGVMSERTSSPCCAYRGAKFVKREVGEA